MSNFAGFEFNIRFTGTRGEQGEPVTTYTFYPPTTKRRVRLAGRVIYSYFVGLSVFRIGGTWFEKYTPSWRQRQDADRFYEGGHKHDLSAERYEELVLAGYGANIIIETRVP